MPPALRLRRTRSKGDRDVASEVEPEPVAEEPASEADVAQAESPEVPAAEPVDEPTPTFLAVRRLPGLVLARQDLSLLLADPVPLVLLLGIPMVFVGFLKPAGFLALVAEGYPGTNGAEQAVPGAAATFSLFVTGLVGLTFFREHGWGTWPRLRASPAGATQVLVGKLLPLTVFSLVQLGLIFGAGAVVFDLHVKGPVMALVVVSVPVALCSVALGVALVAVCRSLSQLNALANLGTALLAGVGGALMPLRLLPHWVRVIGPVSPAYWAMKAYRAVILDGDSLSGVVRPCLFLLGFTAAFTLVAVLAFSSEEHKTAWS